MSKADGATMLNIGQSFREEQYIVLKKLTDSDFLVTYLAYMPFLERYVTLVVLNQRYRDEVSSRFFHYLASTTARLNHPNIVKVYEAGEEEGVHFYAQEYRLGETLKRYLDYISEQDSCVLHLLPIMLQLCELVEYCQGKQIVHGHLSPDELHLAEAQQVLVSGFCELDNYNKREVTQLHAWGLSPYFSPETATGGLANVNSDIFSVGALLYRMIVGEWATHKAASKPSLESSVLAVSLPQELSDLVWDALTEDPSIRIQSISPLRKLLEDILSRPNFNVLSNDLVFQQWYKTLSLPAFQKVNLISRVGKSWRQALDGIADEGALREALQDITMALCEALWARSPESQIRHFNGLYYGMIAQPLVKIRIPSSFPIIFVPFQTIDQGRMEVIQDLVRTVLPPYEYFAVLVPLLRSEQLDRLAGESVYDFVVLDEDGLREIIAAENSQDRFVRAILQQIDLISLSPYIIRGPVPKSMFFGREHEIKNVVQSIKNTSITIIGGRKIGKTSILHRVEQILGEERWNTVYIDCQSVSNYEDFFAVLDFEVEASLSGTDPLDFLRFVEYLRRKYSNSSVVLLLDEEDALLNYDHQNGETLSKLFRSLSQTDQCRFIFCGERGLHVRQRDPASPFFNFCHPISLRYLDRQAVTRIISEPMRNLGLTLYQADGLFERIYRISSGHPNIVQYICHRLVESIAQTKRRYIAPADLAAIQTGHDFFEYFLEVIWGTATPLERLVSLLVETREFTFRDIKRGLKAEGIEATYEQITEALDNLVLYAIFERRGTGEYKLTASSLPDVVHKHDAMGVLRDSLYKEAARWLKQSSNPRGH